MDKETITSLFKTPTDIDYLWANLDQFRSNHDKLKELFIDGNKPEHAMVSNNKHVVVRSVHGSGVIFQIYTLENFIKSQYIFLKNKGRL